MRTVTRIVLSIILMLMFTLASNAFEEVLYVDNSSFEEETADGLAYWSNINGRITPVGTYERSAEKHYDGKYSAKISKPDSSGKMGIFSAGSFGVHEYRWYNAEAYVYTEDSTLTPELYIEFLDMNSIKCASYKVTGTAGKGEWEKLSVTAIAPQGAVMARIMPYINEGSYGTMYVDAVSLTKKPILDNTTFDDGIEGWSAVSGSISHEDGMLKVVSGKARTNAHYAASGVEQVVAGKVSGITGGKAYVTLAFLTSGKEVNTVKKEVTDGEFSVRGYTPLDVTTVNVYLEAEGEAYFDDLLLTPAHKGTQVVDGSFEAMGENNSSPWTTDTVSTNEELFPGGNFEENGWTISHAHTVGGISSQVYASGNRSGYFTTTNSGGLRSPLIPVTVGTTYTASMKYLSPNSDMQFYIEFWSDGPVDAASSKRIGVNLVRPVASSGWKEATVSHKAPSGSKYMTVLVYYSAAGAGTDRTAYTDDISIIDGNGNTVFTEGFENLTNIGLDWTNTNSARGSFILNASKKFSGEKCLTITTNGTGGVGARSPAMPAEAGKEYTAKAKYITSNTTFYVYLEFWTDEKLTTRLNENRVNLTPCSDWKEGKITIKAPAGTKYVTALYYFLQTEGGAVGYIDDVCLESAGTDKTYETMTAEALTEGSYSLKLNNYATSSYSIPVLTGKNYVAVGNVNSNIAGGAEMMLSFHDNMGNLISTKSVKSKGTGIERIVIDTVAPIPSFSSKITLKSTGESYFDGVELFTVADTIANPSFENTDFKFSGKHATQWQSFGDVAALTYGDKYLENPDGTFAMEMYGTGEEGGIRSNMIKVSECEDYTARIMAKGDGGIRIAFFDDNFEKIDESSIKHFSKKDWTKYSVSGTAPYDAVYAAVEIAVEHGDYVIVDAAEFSKRVVNIGNKHQLFIDDFIIDETDGITRTFHQAEKTEPVLEPTPGLAHENDGVYVYGTVIYDEEDGLYKMWYASYDSKSYDTGVVMACYATSVDAVNWDKPNLGLVSYNGSKNNNIIGQYHLQSVILDKDEADHSKKFKMITYDLDGKYSTHYSADGIRWTRSTDFLTGMDVVTASKDNTNGIFYSLAKVNLMKRNQWTLTATDIDNWSVPVPANTLADLIDTRLCYKADSYGMGLYERDGVYIGFNWLFYIPGTYGAEGVIEPQLAFSRDLTDEWQRPTRMPIIPLGEAGSSDDGMIFTTSSALEMGDEVWVYCGAWDGDHGVVERGCNIYIAKWRIDGFASLDSEYNGVVTTRPLVFDGEALYINANAEEGSIYVELLDADGNPIDGFTKEQCRVINSDNVNHTVSWEGNSDVSELAGEEISIRLYMDNSELYSFRFGENTVKAPESVEEYALRASGEKSGMRFLAEVEASWKNICDEYGFIVARNDVLEKIGVTGNDLTFNLTHEKYPEPLGTLYQKGIAYKVENDVVTVDKVYKDTSEGDVIFAAVCTGIDVNDKAKVTTKMTVRPYIMLNGTYAYGKPMTKSLYEVALLLKDGEVYDTLNDECKKYIYDIIDVATK